MRGRCIVVWSFLVSCLAFAPVASAGHPQERQGFWISFGAGVGSAKVTCDDCGGGRETGPIGHVALGGTLNERLLLGVDASFWSKEQEGVAVNLYNGLVTLTCADRYGASRTQVFTQDEERCKAAQARFR